ncbi:MAG: DUF1566 domain-containing protein [Bacteroidales bacterium]|nr:DUF1566 domain-containing protein [Bacteroidales bacterium]
MKSIFRILPVVVFLWAICDAVVAQDAPAKKMQVLRDGVVVFERSVALIDSIFVTGGVTIDGVTWATCNVDAPGTFAANPTDYGMFYQWNRKVGWSSSNPMVNSDGGTTWDSSIPTGTTWEATNDPCPAGWRVPTLAELQGLVNSVSELVTNYNGTGVNGRVFGSGANSIFLPAAGYRSLFDGSLLSQSYGGYYWSSTPYESDSSDAYSLHFYGSYADWYNDIRAHGQSIRCVADNTTGIDDVKAEKHIRVYPNPVKDELYIDIPSFEKTKYLNTQIIDISGRAVETGHATSLQNGEGQGVRINVSRLPCGVYFLRIGDKTARFVKK